MAERDLTGELLFDKLRVLRRVGAGGMGAVYEVEHRLTKHRRALKVLHEDAAMDADVVARFLREAGVAGTIASPYVVETFDAGRLPDGAPYLLMELLRGASLASTIASHGRLPASDVAYLARQVCEGLAAAHRVGIVHRDLKPDNLFLVAGEDGDTRAKILDFGISKFTKDAPTTQSGLVVGTPQYMSPEQAHGVKDLDARSDVYSLGVVMYECVTGVSPFAGETLAAVLSKILLGDYVPLTRRAPELEPAFAAVVERAMSREREARFASARELADALAPFARAVSLVPREPVRAAGPEPEPERSVVPMGEAVDVATADTLASVRPVAPPRDLRPPVVPAADTEPVAFRTPMPRRTGLPMPVLVTGIVAVAAVAVAAIATGGGAGSAGAHAVADAGAASEMDAGGEPDSGVAADAGAEADGGAEPDAGATPLTDGGARRGRPTKAQHDGLITNVFGGGH